MHLIQGSRNISTIHLTNMAKSRFLRAELENQRTGLTSVKTKASWSEFVPLETTAVNLWRESW